MDSKALRGVEIKDADKGHVTAVFSTFDVVDHDGDITVKGAIKDGTQVRISAYNHGSWKGALPVGKGIVRVSGDQAMLEGEFFMNTTHGRDTFEVVKQLADQQEWSYGFDVVESEQPDEEHKSSGAKRVLKELRVHEVSPVMIGAGINTTTVSVKKRFTEEAEAVLADLKALRERAAEVMAKRAEKGRGLGEESGTLMSEIRDELAKLESLLDESPKSTDVDGEAHKQWLRSIANDL